MYTKYHDPWLSSHPLTGEAMNHIDGLQWANIKNYADAHNHNDRYYTKTEADAKYFTEYFYTGADADLLDGYHAAQLIPAGLPIGAIMIWSGAVGNIPSGWYECNGGTHNGYTTPDLRSRFVIAAGGTYAVGATGGATSYTPTGSMTISGHAITVDELPSHTHTYLDKSQNPAGCSSYLGTAYAAIITGTTTMREQTSGNETHTHSATITFNSIDLMPPYYAIYYIMKCV